MLDYLQKFNSLPKALRDKVSSAAAIKAMEKLEKQYGIDLAALIMRVMVKEVAFDDITKWLMANGLNQAKAQKLKDELKANIFFEALDYLGIGKPPADTTKQAQAKQAALPDKVQPIVVNNEVDLSTLLSEQKNFAEPEVLYPAAGNFNHINNRASQSVKGAHFFFSPEDEEEIRELTQKVGGNMPAGFDQAASLEEKLNHILKITEINFGSEALALRFRQIIKTYLSGIRNKVETKLTLVKPLEAGGLSFDQESADQVLNIIDNDGKGIRSSKAIKPAVQPAKSLGLEKNILSDLAKTGWRGAEYDLASSLKQAAERQTAGLAIKEVPNHGNEPRTAVEPALSKSPNSDNQSVPTPAAASAPFREVKSERLKAGEVVDTAHELAPLTPMVVKAPAAKPPAREILKPKPNQPPIQKIKSALTPETSPVIARLTENQTSGQPSGKTKIEDVKFIPKIMGPIDELRYMNLANFRRLAANPADIVEKIREKLNLLEEESYAKRMEGIKAWRLSLVNKMYLDMGQASIGGNKTIDDIIEERRSQGLDCLTAAEFEGIMDLNKSLRF